MSKKRFVFTEALPPEKCQRCGEMAELRPYGVGGLWVCFGCGMADEATAKTMFDAQFKEGKE